ncbi:MAG: glycosyltransferase family protein [Flavobacteriaceae bacterium]|jgi:GT2 family glycosyltransferase|nr:glycosyltransferase family protein [Flavobacteriaceae bacterium]
MISIIICSKKGNISEFLKSNIEATINVPFELIVIDNSENKYSIFSAYNEGVKRSSYDYLCFIHEDVLYHSKDWGNKVLNHLADPKTGLIGLAGSYYLLDIPSTWYKAKPSVKNLIQSYAGKSKLPKTYSLKEAKEVVCVDGFWFCSRKDVFEKVAFDHTTFEGFHFYDLDISMQIHEKGYKIWVIPDIIVEHFSGGNLNKQWLVSSYLFYEKWKKYLPITVNPSLKKKNMVDVKAFRDLLYLHKKYNYPIPAKTWKLGWNKLGINLITAYFLSIIK